jgi:hypothetical protein
VLSLNTRGTHGENFGTAHRATGKTALGFLHRRLAEGEKAAQIPSQGKKAQNNEKDQTQIVGQVFRQMSFSQLNPSLPVTVEGKGKGVAFAVIDYGEEHNLIWVVALDESGEIWCSPNPKVRMRSNWTMGRTSNPVLSVAAE